MYEPNHPSHKKWISYFVTNNIVVKTGIYAEVSEGRDYLSVGHQIVENRVPEFNRNGIDRYSFGVRSSL